MGQRALVALDVRRLDRDDGSLDTRVLVRRLLGLCAEAEASGLFEQTTLAGISFRDDPELAAGLVSLPDRNRQRTPAGLLDADDSHVKLCQKRLTLGLVHLE